MLLGLLATIAVVEPLPATAQSGQPEASSRQRRPVRPVRIVRSEPAVKPGPIARAATARPTPPTRVAAPKPIPVPKVDLAQQPPEPLVAVISLASQRMVVYGGQGVVAETKVSTGQAGHRTPTGVFSILQRNRYHESNIYSGAPMPFMQRLTWSGIALHQGVVPGYPASHGCIRMPADFAPRMWGLGRLGMRVLVTSNDVTPTMISSPRLPVPVMTTVDGAAMASLPVHTVSIAAATPPPAPPSAAAAGSVAPYPLAHFRRAKALADQIALEREIKAAQELAAERSAEANRASEELRRLEQRLAAVEEDLEDKREAYARNQNAADDSAEARAASQAAADLEAVETQLAAARLVERQASDSAFDSAKSLRALQARGEELAADVRLAAAGLEPVSIFVSRKEGKVFVRQGFTPIHEEAITIVEPIRPLGTHVFTAIQGVDGGAGLRWQAVTLPSNPPVLTEGDQSRRRGAQTPPQTQLPASNATGALERFELPPETLKLIADRLWAGATLTVSDFGISNETGRGTDFVVLTQ
ncbi:MAG: L,D-transpeptidase family protein [Hyphomicrobiaceae bacterium]